MDNLILQIQDKINDLESQMQLINSGDYSKLNNVCLQLYQLTRLTFTCVLDNSVTITKPLGILSLYNLVIQKEGVTPTLSNMYHYVDLLYQWYYKSNGGNNFTLLPRTVSNTYKYLAEFIKGIQEQSAERRAYAKKVSFLPTSCIEGFEYLRGISCVRAKLYDINYYVHDSWVIFTNPEMKDGQVLRCTILDVCTEHSIEKVIANFVKKGYIVGAYKTAESNCFIGSTMVG